MESTFYAYLKIQPPNANSSYALPELRAFLDKQNQLNCTDTHHYRNKDGAAFISLFLAFLQGQDSWSSKDIHPAKTNCIIIVAGKMEDIIPAETMATCTDIARLLQWDLIEETDDEYLYLLQANMPE